MKKTAGELIDKFRPYADAEIATLRQSIIAEKAREEPDRDFIRTLIREIQKLEGYRELPSSCGHRHGFINKLTSKIAEDDYSSESKP